MNCLITFQGRFSSMRRSARKKLRNVLVFYGESMMFAADGSPSYELHPMRSQDYYYNDEDEYDYWKKFRKY